MPNPLRVTRLLVYLGAATLISIGVAAATRPPPAARADDVDLDAPSSSFQSGDGEVHLVVVDGVINPVATTLIQDAISDASRAGAECVILQLDTPGGLVKSMQEICQAILAAPTPFVTYVGPAGARATSAGTFVTLAAPIAAMNVSSTIGAAHPVQMGFATADTTLAEKAMNDLVSFARSLAERYERNADWAELAVRESASLTSKEALARGVVDLLVDDLDDLLIALDGWEIEVGGVRRELSTRGARIVRHEMDLRLRILDYISDPNIAYVLLTLGMLGLTFELISPGGIVPGVVGGIFLILAFYALHTLPVNYAGVLLIVLAIILFLLEIKVASYGVLSIGGVVAMLLGSLMLIDRSIDADFLKIRLQVIVPVVVLTLLVFVFAIAKGILAQRRRPATGTEGLIGAEGIAVQDFGPGRDGQVQVHGELWVATADQSIQRGEAVRVRSAQGLKLLVERG